MNGAYKIFLDFFSQAIITKNKLLKNYFNPESAEAQRLFEEIFRKVSSRYPEIEEAVVLKIKKNIVYSKKEADGGIIRIIRLGEAILRKNINDIRIYSSVFNLFGFKKENYIFIVAHELFHIVHYLYYKDEFLQASCEFREWFADKKAIELFNEYYPGITLCEYNKEHSYSKKIIFWHKMINNYVP